MQSHRGLLGGRPRKVRRKRQTGERNCKTKGKKRIINLKSNLKMFQHSVTPIGSACGRDTRKPPSSFLSVPGRVVSCEALETAAKQIACVTLKELECRVTAGGRGSDSVSL